MKKILKSRLFFFILGLIIATTVGVSATILYQADEVGFTPNNPNWNVTNIEEALNDLYAKKGNNEEFANNAIWNFPYSGNEQEFVVPVSGKYKIETWGAQGGNVSSATSKIPGYGGYSIGYITLNKNEKLYINVGGKGNNSSGGIGGSGGYNGGGAGSNGYNNDAAYPGGGGGGGATHIATISGLLQSLSDYKGEISENNAYYISNKIIIVSGGGGGVGSNYTCATCAQNGGAGGGAKGVNGITFGATLQAYGGTQTTGYSFGKGAKGRNGTNAGNASYEGVGGGGAGFFGGKAQTSAGITTDSSGGGGSGYIANPNLSDKYMICYDCDPSDESETKTITNECHNSTPSPDCSKEGNGYARITYIG